jgi:F-type H+-transporting ATPase subunit gamma
MNSIRDTLKITNAMYMISSSKLRKARKSEERVEAYFQDIRSTIGDILLHAPDLEHRYLESAGRDSVKPPRRAYIVLTADKGMAGAYNHNVIKAAQEELEQHPDSLLFVVGQVGRHTFREKGAAMAEDFQYSIANPSLQRARSITVDVLDAFEKGVVGEVYLIYTHMKNALQTEVQQLKLLPLTREQFAGEDSGDDQRLSFFPSEGAVLEQTVPITVHGLIYSAMTESYCAELSDRMTAMDGASKSAKEMLSELELAYNRARQYGITQEITEVSAGSKAQQKNARKKAPH